MQNSDNTLKLIKEIEQPVKLKTRAPVAMDFHHLFFVPSQVNIS